MYVDYCKKKKRGSAGGISNPETSLFKVLNLRQKATKKTLKERKKERKPCQYARILKTSQPGFSSAQRKYIHI